MKYNNSNKNSIFITTYNNNKEQNTTRLFAENKIV